MGEAMREMFMPKSAEAYERAIVRAEKTFRKNKSRMWVLKILREYLVQEASEE